jgi:U3 small nucleolar RNA-associated protein 3
VDDDGSDEIEGDDDEGFYAQQAKKSKQKKEFKKNLYQVAPKFPRVEKEVEGERAIGNQILKNRGLVPHKSKLNRNPRVKKREQYRKALIRRKGTVREVRKDEGHKYGGEETGIKTGLSRSRKLVS